MKAWLMSFRELDCGIIAHRSATATFMNVKQTQISHGCVLGGVPFKPIKFHRAIPAVHTGVVRLGIVMAESVPDVDRCQLGYCLTGEAQLIHALVLEIK